MKITLHVVHTIIIRTAIMRRDQADSSHDAILAEYFNIDYWKMTIHAVLISYG